MLKRFPPTVLATAFATLIAFMGIGVVDPILNMIGKAMGATPFQVEWLFTSYIAIMAVTMLLSGVLSVRFGGRRVMMIGLALVVAFATLSGFSNSISFLAWMRAGWGLGNAFFSSTALSIIVGASSGGMASAITLYEAALGIGIAAGPLLGGALGQFSWRYPFFGTAVLMATALVLTTLFVREPKRKEQSRSAMDIFRALGDKGVLANSIVGLCYSFAFFTLLAYSPLTLPKNLSSNALGLTFFGWGVLVGISSVFVVNWLRPHIGPTRLLQMNLIALIGVFCFAAIARGEQLIWVIIASGFFCGIANAMFTTVAMEVSPFARSISSGAYNFVRWAGAAVAPISAGYVGQNYGMNRPFWLAAGLLFIGLLISLGTNGIVLRGVEKNGDLG